MSGIGEAGFGIAHFLLHHFQRGAMFLFGRAFRETCNRLHTATDRIRDDYFDLYLKCQQRQLDERALRKAVRDTGQTLVDILSQILQDVTKQPIVSTLKLIVSTGSDPEYASVVRSNNVNVGRPDDGERFRISQCAPLEEIYFRHKSTYVRNELRQYAKRNGFNNPNPDWARHYNSLMVVPIRIRRELIDATCKDPREYEIVGFFWCDSVAAKPFRASLEPICVAALLCVADGFYHFLERINHYRTRLP
ncbi:MAG: hypothetical protein HY913_18800 [Desulfomonile tiedjei]|nr:hypothetical protein [Desulfomonile tiedjei]